MTKSKKPTTKMKSASTQRRGANAFFRRQDAALVPLAALTLYCWYFTLSNIGGIGYLIAHPHLANIVFNLPLISVLVALFGTIFLYKEYRREATSKYARVIAYLFSILAVIAAIILLSVAAVGPNEPQCTGLMGARTSCDEVSLLYFSIYFLNPIALVAWGALSISAGVTLLRKK